MPGRIPDDLDIGFCDSGQAKNLLLGITGNDPAHAAAGSGEGHFYRDAMAALLGWLQGEVLDEAKVNDVYWDFGIKAGFQRVPDLLLEVVLRRCRFFCGGVLQILDRDSEGICIFPLDPEQATSGPDGKGAAKVLCDVDPGSLRQGDRVPGGDLDGWTFALELDGADLLHV
jgi:hypothetical protein